MRLGNFVCHVAVVFALLVIAGCSVRSISDSGYSPNPNMRGPGAGNPFYRGELSEFEILGIDRAQAITEEEIQKSFAAKQAMTIRKGSSILLVQSGAIFPDDRMVRSLEQYYTVAGFSGAPEQSMAQHGSTVAPPPYSSILRLAAARGGYEKIVVYWGILETAREGLGGKALSWAPFIGGAIPDENQRMRIRLKVAVVDVRTGQWEMFAPASLDDQAMSARYNREASDQEQVALLKDKAYKVAAEDIVKRYAR